MPPSSMTPLKLKLTCGLKVTAVLPEWSAVRIDSGGDSAPKRDVVVAVNGRRPRQKVGDVIPAGSTVRFAWNLALVPGIRDCGALQAMAAKDLFAHSAGCNVVHGDPGTGKSRLMHMVVQNARRLGHAVLCIAPTALVARAMPDGSWIGEPVVPMTVRMFLCRKVEELIPSLKGGRPAKKRPRVSTPSTLFLLVDEAFMVRSEELDAALRKARRIVPTVRLVLFGDHMQLQPPQTVVGTWSSHAFKDARATEDLAVYKLTKQRRYGGSPRMLELMADLRARRVQSANRTLQLLATEKLCPTAGTCRTVAATNALADEVNVAAHSRIARKYPESVTRYTARRGNPPTSVSFAPGELVRVRSNVFTVEKADKDTGKGGGVRYQQVNGMLGEVCDLPGGVVDVDSTTRVAIRLVGGRDAGNKLFVAPRRSAVMRAGRVRADSMASSKDDEDVPAVQATALLHESDDDDDDEGGKRRKSKNNGSMAWSFEDALTPSTGQTVHAVQGATFAEGDRCVVKMKGFPKTRDGYNMLIVALSRVRSTKDLFIQDYDPDILPTLAAACPCGCTASDSRARFPLAHNEDRLKALEDHLESLDCYCRAVFAL